jgi:hypothetical protein
MKEWIHKAAAKIGAALSTGCKALGGWLKSVPSEPNGTGSSSRIALLMLTTTICWLLYAYYHYHGSLPDKDTLLGLAALLSAVCGAYGINKWMNKDGGNGQ